MISESWESGLQKMPCVRRALRPEVLLSAAGGVKGENAREYAASGVDFLVSTWPYFGRPVDVKMTISRL